MAQQQQTRNKLRQSFRERRNSLSLEAHNTAAQAVVQRCEDSKLFDNCKHVALYTSFNGELNTSPLIHALWQRKISVYLPVIHPFCKGYLLFLRYTDNTPMQSNQFGILEPKLDVSQIILPTQLDILFTPLVAFDDHGNRLGMGGGFYDRTLKALQTASSSTQPKVIGLALDIQKTNLLPTESWDIPLPFILTPSKLYTFM